MSGETEASVSGWTTDTLKEYIDNQLRSMDLRYQQRYDSSLLAQQQADEARQKALDAALLAAEKAVTTALLAAEKAVTKAELAADKRFEAVNEFRGQLNDQAATFMSRTEYNTAHEALEKTVTDLANRFNRTEGHSTGLNAAWALLLGVAALISVAVTIIVATR